MRPHKLNKKTLPGFVKKNVCKVQIKTYKPAPSKHETASPVGQRWANVVDGGPAPAQHRDNDPCLLGILDILRISKKLNKVMIQ